MDKEQARKDEEAWQADAIARRGVWRKDYENELRSLGMETPWPHANVTLEDEIGDDYRTRLKPIPFLGANITGARLKNDKVPSGATIREIMLLTDGDIGRPPCIDAEINGVRLLLRWNGSKPRVQYTSVLTAKEVQTIQGFTGESKGESTKGDPRGASSCLEGLSPRTGGLTASETGCPGYARSRD